jgi:hypothetical protein
METNDLGDGNKRGNGFKGPNIYKGSFEIFDPSPPPSSYTDAPSTKLPAL